MLEILYRLWNIAIALILSFVMMILIAFIYNFIKTKIFGINKKDKTTNYKIEDRYPDKRKWSSYDDYDNW